MEQRSKFGILRSRNIEHLMDGEPRTLEVFAVETDDGKTLPTQEGRKEWIDIRVGYRESDGLAVDLVPQSRSRV